MARRLIKALKRMEDAGEWHQGKVPQSAFPVYGKGTPLGPSWHWRLVKATADRRQFRLLVAVRPDKGEFMAALGVMDGSRVAVLAVLEDHATHEGLHCHASCDRFINPPAGTFRYPGMKRLPWGNNRRTGYVWTRDTAWQTALQFYRVTDMPEGALL